jgi:hypothetical protein
VLLGEIIENQVKTMDFMFEDDVDEVGSDVEAYCPKCKTDTTHVVISKYEDEIRRVQCNPCGDVHSFRKPRGEAEEDIPEPVAARKRALLKKLTWEEFFAKHGDKNAKPYEFRDTYRENAIVFHPKFGKGFVSEVVSESKVEITFTDARRILVHNRKDIPGSPVGREDDGLPSTAVPTKSGTKGIAKASEKADKTAAKPLVASKDAAGAVKPPAKKAQERTEESAREKPAAKKPPVEKKAVVEKKPVAEKATKKVSEKKPAAEKAKKSASDKKPPAKKPAPEKMTKSTEKTTKKAAEKKKSSDKKSAGKKHGHKKHK